MHFVVRQCRVRGTNDQQHNDDSIDCLHDSPDYHDRSPEFGARIAMSLGQLLVYPLRGQGGVLWVLCAVGLFVLLALFEWTRLGEGQHLLAMVLLPIPWLITFAILQHYAWASLSHVAAGNDETIRSIAIEDVSPLNNFLAFKVAALLFGLAGLIAASFSTDVALGTSVAVVVGVVLPAILGVMILEEEFLAGFDARRLAAFVIGLGPAYAVFALLLYAAIAVLYAACLVISPPSIIAMLVGGYAFMLGHVLAGRVLYLCRDRLGLLTLLEKDPQHVAAVADNKAIEALMVELHRLCAVDRVDRANKLLEGFLEKDAFVHDERIHQRLEMFQDKRLKLEHNWHYLNRLLDAKKVLRAWSLVRESLEVDPLFRPGSAEATLALVAAAPATDAGYVDLLLSDFERAYADSERAAEGVLEHARWLVAKLERVDAALERLAVIERQFPEWADEPQFLSFRERVRRLAN